MQLSALLFFTALARIAAYQSGAGIMQHSHVSPQPFDLHPPSPANSASHHADSSFTSPGGVSVCHPWPSTSAEWPSTSVEWPSTVTDQYLTRADQTSYIYG